MGTSDLQELGLSIKKSREDRRWTQKDLAVKVGISRSLLAKFEKGTRRLSEDTLNKLLDCLRETEAKPEYTILIDYLAIHFFSNDYQKLVEEVLGIKLKYFEQTDFAPLGYTGRFTRNDTINVLYSVDDPEKGTLLDLTGQGCKHLAMLLNTRKMTWQDFFAKVFQFQGNFTRIDFTLDDPVGILDIPELAQKTQLGHIKTVFRTSDVNYSTDISNSDSNGLTLYLGSRKSNCRFCFYQKDYEQRKRRGISLEDATIKNRFELRYRKEKAQKLAEEMMTSSDFESLFFELINGAVCFYDGDPDEPGTRIDPKWAEFISNHGEISLSLETTPQTFSKSINWLSHGVAPTLSFINEVDRLFGSSLLTAIIDTGEMNPHQEKIMENMREEPDFYQPEVDYYEHELRQKRQRERC